MNLFSFLNRRARWSNEAFSRTENRDARLAGVLEHIESEIEEIRKDPFDPMVIKCQLCGFEKEYNPVKVDPLIQRYGKPGDICEAQR